MPAAAQITLCHQAVADFAIATTGISFAEGLGDSSHDNDFIKSEAAKPVSVWTAATSKALSISVPVIASCIDSTWRDDLGEPVANVDAYPQGTLAQVDADYSNTHVTGNEFYKITPQSSAQSYPGMTHPFILISENALDFTATNRDFDSACAIITSKGYPVVVCVSNPNAVTHS